MSYLFTLPVPAVPVVGSADLFPVRRIYCVGRNYADHAKEMGFSEREAPFFFMKPADAVVPGGGPVAYPPCTDNLHHEIELVVAIGRGGAHIPVDQAQDHIHGYAVGLDMTRRDLQLALRDKGHPWDMGKGFDQSAPLSSITPASAVGHLERGAIWLKVNDVERQRSDIAKLIWSVPEVITNLSEYVTLAPGDLIFTGTPEGVGKVVRGDELVGGIDGLGELRVILV
ncbi:MAG: fumarylacetoacetate hydrolase family protein [Pseudomonadota bacterium]